MVVHGVTDSPSMFLSSFLQMVYVVLTRQVVVSIQMPSAESLFASAFRISRISMEHAMQLFLLKLCLVEITSKPNVTYTPENGSSGYACSTFRCFDVFRIC